MESVPAIFPNQPTKQVVIKKDASVMLHPSIGGGVGRYMNSTPNGAMIDIKGIARELAHDQFSLPERDYEDTYEKGNDWFHMTQGEATPGTQNDKPEFRQGDIVKIADVYGTVIGPGMGVFIAYSTTGQEAIVNFDGKEMVVPVANVGAAYEQDAKDEFNQMDNDGNLSTLSFGSENVKIDQPVAMSGKEPEMDNRDEFQKWISAVEEALSSEGKQEVVEEAPCNACGCGNWDCDTCFPEPGAEGGEEPVMSFGPNDAMGPVVGETGGVCPTCGHECGHDDEMGCMSGELEVVPADDSEFAGFNDIDKEFEYDESGSGGGCGAGGMAASPVDMEEGDVDDWVAAGGEIQQLPYKNRPRSAASAFGSKHIGTGKETSRSQLRGTKANVSTKQNPSVKPVVDVEEEEENFIEKPKSGKGVKLGDIIHKTEFRKVGQDSPMTDAEHNLDEEPDSFDGMDGEPDDSAFGHDGMMRGAQDQEMTGQEGFGDHDEEQEKSEMLASVEYMQNLGLSKSDQHYSVEQMAAMSPDEIKKIHDEVMGTVSEAKPAPTKTRHPDLDFLDDFFAADPEDQADAPAVVEPADHEVAGDQPMDLPTAGRDTTQRSVSQMRPSDTMRDFMNRINPDAGAAEPALPDNPENELVLRTANEVPAVISNAMQAAGMTSPTWHKISNLPGFQDRNVRGMGRGMFGMFTNTPVDQIKTIANVEGQGPNTDAEMRAVGRWLMDNAEDLGQVEVSHGMAIPGYEPDVKEYKANGVRFHVVRDPMGQYIYAYPDKDAKNLLGGPGQEQGQLPGRGNMPRLRESTGLSRKLSLVEELKWEEQVREELAILEAEELEESSLSKKIGDKPGAKKLIQWMHRNGGLSNYGEIEPHIIKERPFWKQFKRNPDDFFIVVFKNGVAGIKPDQKYFDHMKTKHSNIDPGLAYNVPYHVVAFKDDGKEIDPSLFQVKATPKKKKVGEAQSDDYITKDPTVTRKRMGITSGPDEQAENIMDQLRAELGPLIAAYTIGWENSKYEPGSGLAPEISKGAVERDKIAHRAAAGETIPKNYGADEKYKRLRQKQKAEETIKLLTAKIAKTQDPTEKADLERRLRAAEKALARSTADGEPELPNGLDTRFIKKGMAQRPPERYNPTAGPKKALPEGKPRGAPKKSDNSEEELRHERYKEFVSKFERKNPGTTPPSFEKWLNYHEKTSMPFDPNSRDQWKAGIAADKGSTRRKKFNKGEGDPRHQQPVNADPLRMKKVPGSLPYQDWEKTEREKARFSKPIPKETTVSADQAKQQLFGRLRKLPSVKSIVDSALGDLKYMMTQISNQDDPNVAELTKYANLRKELNDFKVAVDTTRDVPMTGAVGRAIDKAVRKITGHYPGGTEFNDYIRDLADAPTKSLLPLVRELKAVLEVPA